MVPRTLNPSLPTTSHSVSALASRMQPRWSSMCCRASGSASANVRLPAAAVGSVNVPPIRWRVSWYVGSYCTLGRHSMGFARLSDRHTTSARSRSNTSCTGRGCYGCFLVIEAQGGTWFRTPCPNSQRSRHTSVSGSAPTPRTGSVQGYDPLSDSAQIAPPPDPLLFQGCFYRARQSYQACHRDNREITISSKKVREGRPHARTQPNAE